MTVFVDVVGRGPNLTLLHGWGLNGAVWNGLRDPLARDFTLHIIDLLLDEPFSRLDALLRTQFRTYVFEQIARLAIPTLLVTHDPADVPPGGRVIAIADWAGSATPPAVKSPNPSQ